MAVALSVQNHSERGHSEFGGSSAERAVHCTGSVFLKRQVPSVKAGPDAERGTAIHEAFSELLGAFLKFKEDGTKFDQDLILDKLAHSPHVGEEHIEESVEMVVQAVEDIWVKGFEQSLTGKVYGLEERFEYDVQHDSGGIVDVWFSYINDKGQRVLAVYDLKTGRTPVDPKEGQIPFYACAIRKFLKEHGKDIDVCRAIIYQPKDFESVSPWKESRLTKKQLDAWDKKFFNALHQIYVLQKPKFKVGSWCVFCAGQTHCKAYKKEYDKQTALKLADPEAELPAIEVLSHEQRLAIAMNKGKIEKYLKAVYTSVLNDVLRGQKIEGIKVVAANSKRRWIKDEDKILQHLKALGLSSEDCYNHKLKPFGELERKLGKKSLDTVLEKPPGKPILVTEDDERQAVTGGAELLAFGDDEE